MGRELDNRLPVLPSSGSVTAEDRRAHLDAEIERRGLSPDANIMDVLDDSHERGRQRLIARHDLPGDSDWLDIHYHLTAITIMALQSRQHLARQAA